MSKSSDGKWEPPKNVKPYIVCAANRYGDVVVTGARHFDDVMHQAITLIWRGTEKRQEVCADMEQGFIDQWGRFYSRVAAMNAVRISGQPFDLDRNGGDLLLYSEGLY